MNTMELSYLLHNSDFFKGFSERSIKSIQNICIPKTLKKKSVLFLEGDKGFSLYLIESGTIKLYKTGDGSQDTTIKVVKPGEIFGEVILFERDRYPVSAAAVEDSRLYMLPKHQFHCLLNGSEFSNEFIGMLMKKQRYLTEQLMNLTSFDVEKRFFRYLRSQFGEKEEYKIKFSKKEMAADIGTAPETFSRLLLRLKKSGTISWEGKILRIQKDVWKEFTEPLQ